jgi:hypothetical protein
VSFSALSITWWRLLVNTLWADCPLDVHKVLLESSSVWFHQACRMSEDWNPDAYYESILYRVVYITGASHRLSKTLHLQIPTQWNNGLWHIRFSTIQKWPDSCDTISWTPSLHCTAHCEISTGWNMCVYIYIYMWEFSFNILRTKFLTLFPCKKELNTRQCRRIVTSFILHSLLKIINNPLTFLYFFPSQHNNYQNLIHIYCV